MGPMTNPHPVSVKATFTLPAETISEVHDDKTCQPAVLGLPEGVTPTKPRAGNYKYSGMHDQGPVPAPREGGPYALLIGCVGRAKARSDELLSRLIREEKEALKKRKNKEADGTNKRNAA
eukprot:CAMPEP_0172502332 /NCGR_PEP_ID=MMETSP1066-20121228/158876_1 /TAXON_ID=671091 /ORGANISM="Coscinodiscus wailesii, Strain CCMP2513" /LENGTH=119 /DNA_ID=CAMNT_0013277545 /DNA_START=102 /DNA_END=461 /DNA_ORIENTATION=+